MKTKKFLIAGGNSTLLVWNGQQKNKAKIIQNALKKVEQVGFMEEKQNLPYLEMMGDELCINATIALAFTLEKRGKFFTSGLDSPVFFKNQQNGTSIGISLPYQKADNTILFKGIGFIYKKVIPKSLKPLLEELALEFTLPAFGLFSYQGNMLIPYVYVRKTNTLLKETACGSASIAASIILGNSKIVQPTGQVITITKNADLFTITAEVNQL